MFVGRNPGVNEDIHGTPFVGKSGEVIDGFLAKCGLTRDDVYITNAILCFTHKDRPPTEEELFTCGGLFLIPTIKQLNPYLVVTFGNEAMKMVSGFDKIGKHHGTVHKHAYGFDLIPCYHPAAGMRNAEYKTMLEFDAEQVRRYLTKRNK